MDLAAELAQFNPDPTLAAWVGKLLDKSQSDALTLQRADLKIRALTLELAYYKRIRFANKSEQFSAEQRELFEESWNTDTSAQEAEVEQLSPRQPVKRVRAGRQPLPDHLLRIEHRHEPDLCTCGQCGKDLVKIGEDISEQLDVEPARFFVHRHIRPQYACRACETISAAPIPAAIIDGGMAAPGLLTWVMISKFQDHLPLYRLEQIATRQQVPLARSTLAEWVGRVGVALQPLVDRLAVLLRERSVLHADETPVPQLDPGKGKTKKAYLWAYRSNDLEPGPPILVFDYQPGRHGLHARNFLDDWHGHLLEDMGKEVYMAVYDQLGATACRILVPGYSEIYPVEDLIWDNTNKALAFRADILNLHSLDDAGLEVLLERLEDSELDDYTDIITLIGVEFDENTAWGQLTILELKLLINLALQQFEAAHEQVGTFLQYNENTVERGLFYQALNVVLEVLLDEELELGDYMVNFRRMFGDPRMDAYSDESGQ